MRQVVEAINDLRQSFRTGRTRSVAWRKSQLGAIIKLINENEEQIFHALFQDLGKHPVECYRDEGNLPLLFFPASGQVISEPLGVVLVFSSWNFPIYLSLVAVLALDPVVGAISAGNAVVLKPSELAPACSSFLVDNIPLYSVEVSGGGVNVGEQLLKQRWYKIFFTGSPKVGQIVMSAAVRHLTPVTRELGGKCPAILDTLSDSNDIKKPHGKSENMRAIVKARTRPRPRELRAYGKSEVKAAATTDSEEMNATA